MKETFNLRQLKYSTGGQNQSNPGIVRYEQLRIIWTVKFGIIFPK